MTLGSLAVQSRVDWRNVEVLVVDNNCSDDTSDVIASFEGRLPIRNVVEKAQGLSHARNRAVREARGEWVIFTDDDVRLEPDWLACYLAAFAAHPEAGLAAGRVLPDWLGQPPTWFTGELLDMLDGVLVWYDIGTGCRIMGTGDHQPVGASIAVRRELLRHQRGFRVDLGVTSTAMGRGEETEFFSRLRAKGTSCVYVGNALCWHAVDRRRLKLSYLYRYGMASGHAHRRAFDPTATGSMLTAAGFIARGLMQLAKGRGDRFRQCIIQAGFQVGVGKARRT